MTDKFPGTKTLTTSAGAPIADNQNAMTAGPLGPLLVQDYQLIEKLAHQNRERIPERTVHAKGWGAYGTLTVTKDITRYTSAEIFSAVGKKTEMLARFSTVAGELGAADHERDVRGFALKFYTEAGQLGPRRQQHARVLRARPLQVPRLHPHAKAPPEDQHALADGDVGFLVAVAGEPAPGDDPVLRPRHAAFAALHARLRLAHLLVLERCRRAPLGEVPLQDAAGHRVPHQPRGRGHRRAHARVLSGRPVRCHRGGRLPQVDACTCR